MAMANMVGWCPGSAKGEILRDTLGYDIDRIADLAAAELLE